MKQPNYKFHFIKVAVNYIYIIIICFSSLLFYLYLFDFTYFIMCKRIDSNTIIHKLLILNNSLLIIPLLLYNIYYIKSIQKIPLHNNYRHHFKNIIYTQFFTSCKLDLLKIWFTEQLMNYIKIELKFGHEKSHIHNFINCFSYFCYSTSTSLNIHELELLE